MTAKPAFAPATTDKFAGGVVMVGVVTMASGATELVTLPTALVTTTEKFPASAAATAVTVSALVVTPEYFVPLVMAPPFFNHLYASGAVPVAVTEKLALPPLATVCAAGWTEIAGGKITVSAAAALVAVPTLLLTSTE